jgi:hypothetical protein
MIRAVTMFLILAPGGFAILAAVLLCRMLSKSYASTHGAWSTRVIDTVVNARLGDVVQDIRAVVTTKRELAQPAQRNRVTA